MDHSLVLQATDEQWQQRCGIQKIMQTDKYGCGIACLAMVSGKTYEQAKEHFVAQGLGVRRKGRAAFSTTAGDMRMAIATAGLMTTTRLWCGWDDFSGLAVIKVRDKHTNRSDTWHWSVAFSHPEYAVAVFDPHREWPGFKHMPQDAICTLWESIRPFGHILLVEQTFPLSH